MDRKTIARLLDAAAARAEVIGRTGATAKQCWFLAGLIAEKGNENDRNWVLEHQLILTKRDASNTIDAFLNPLCKAA